MSKDTKIAVGIRLYVGKHVVEDTYPGEFEKYVNCNIEGVDLGFDNTLECRYYDDMSGYIYFHFAKPVKRIKLELFFEEEEIIDELNTNIVIGKKHKEKCLVKE